MLHISNKLLIALTVLLVLALNPAFAAVKTVTLSVSNMTCAVCPITVKKALQKIPGVQKVNVSYETKEAIVIFDDTKASVVKLETATFEVGYPSKMKTK